MPTWHRLGTKDELLARVPFSTKVDRHQIAVFVYDAQFRAISNSCNHKGGPLSEGRLNGEYVVCPWHAWEYSVLTGESAPGSGTDAAAVYAVEERADGVFVQTPPISARRVTEHDRHPLLLVEPKPPGGPAHVLGISTTAMDDANPRFSTSDALLEAALARAQDDGAETRHIRLRDLRFRPCEGNYSKAAPACTWPCAITERDPDDQLTTVYDSLVNWCDVLLLATPIRWGSSSGLYFKMVERLNCVQNQITLHNKVLIKNKVAAFIITGGQDNIQAVAGNLLVFWSELGFLFPPFPFIAHSRGWDAEDLENNVRQVKASEALHDAAQELLTRSVDFWRVLDHHRLELDRPMERAGRKAHRLTTREEAP
jgi:nitrite reductase/ring-hydroxylating ferredoxin subunit/multimeric flavodoxin WrbA